MILIIAYLKIIIKVIIIIKMQKQYPGSLKGISLSADLQKEQEDQNRERIKLTKSNNGNKQIFNEVHYELNQRKLNEQQMQIQNLIKNKGLIGFGSEIVLSEQISLHSNQNKTDSNKIFKSFANNTQFHLLEQMKKLEISKPINFNIIVAGANNLGKTSFIDAFLKFENNNLIKTRTTQIKYHIGKINQGHKNYNMLMIDTPGFKQNQYKNYYKLLKQQIISRFQQKNKKILNRNQIIQGIQTINNQKIHCCLYFLSGPRLNQSDIYLMKKLQKYVNIIPILAKGDCYTVQQICQIKKQINIQRQKEKLQWFECQDILKNKNENKYNQLINGPFGKAPPFLIVSCFHKLEQANKKLIFGRKYNWGICDIANPEHSDFVLLYNLLLVYFSESLISITDSIQQKYFKRSMEQKTAKMITGISVCTLILVLGYRCATKYLNN